MDMAELLSQVLSDENAMNGIRQMAQNMDMSSMGGLMEMLGQQTGGGQGNGMGGGSGAGPGDARPHSQTHGGDPNVALISALKPFLSPHRRKRANEAMRIMKMLEMLPLLQQSGLLNNLMGGMDDE